MSLARLGLAVRTGSFHVLTPRGRCEADRFRPRDCPQARHARRQLSHGDRDQRRAEPLQLRLVGLPVARDRRLYGSPVAGCSSSPAARRRARRGLQAICRRRFVACRPVDPRPMLVPIHRVFVTVASPLRCFPCFTSSRGGMNRICTEDNLQNVIAIDFCATIAARRRMEEVSSWWRGKSCSPSN